MAIAFGGALNGGRTSGLTHTFSFTTGGSDRVLVVASSLGSLAGGDVITGATYNGVSMTAHKLLHSGTGYMYLFTLLNPASGANDVEITTSLGGQSVYGLAAYYTGVSQTGMPDVVGTNSATTATSLTTNLTTLVDNSWTVLFGLTTNGNIAASTGSTSRAEGDFDFLAIYDSNGPISPAASTSMAFTADSGNMGGIMVSFAPAGAGGRTSKNTRTNPLGVSLGINLWGTP